MAEENHIKKGWTYFLSKKFFSSFFFYFDDTVVFRRLFFHSANIFHFCYSSFSVIISSFSFKLNHGLWSKVYYISQGPPNVEHSCSNVRECSLFFLKSKCSMFECSLVSNVRKFECSYVRLYLMVRLNFLF